MAVHDVFVYLRAKNAEDAIAYYTRAFGAEEDFRLVEPSGRIGHVELRLGGSVLMISDEFPEYDLRGPAPDAPSTFAIHLHVDDADATLARAVEAGGTLVRAPQDHFYGERSGSVRDPFGYHWLIGHAIEEIGPDEMQRRYTAMFDSESG
jgi:uncharacterized glyoxalase superfamily protein PhnB